VRSGGAGTQFVGDAAASRRGDPRPGVARPYLLRGTFAEAHQPVLITRPRANGVLVAEEDWNAIQETLYLLSVPGMRESIRAGLETPIEECQKEPGW
jgi:PHD/YefM family antitoxin component YafN of YafNO toxin-antitoxin module